LDEVRKAATDLADQGKRAPCGTGPVFQNVAQVLLIGTALVSGAVGLVHLWKELSCPRPPHRPNHDPELQGDEDHSAREHTRRGNGRHGRG
jgi:hypothetical protein